MSAPVRWLDGLALAVSLSAQTNTLQALEHRTGWILIAAIDSDSPIRSTRVFQMVRPKEHATPVPEIGDDVRLLKVSPVTILGYRRTGESHRPTSPAGRPLGVFDETGIDLPPGTEVRGGAVQKAPAVGPVTAYWARVEPIRVP